MDDNHTNVAILEEILEDDYQLEIATSGLAALGIIHVFQPTLILLDVRMPGLDGYETCRRIRANPALHHTKIIMVSANVSVAERLQGYAVGADDYITKPFDPEELKAKVHVYLQLKSMEEIDAFKSDVLSLLKHETGTPLHHILLSLELLASEEDLDTETRQEFLDIAQHSAKTLHRFFQKVWTLSQMKSGTYTVQLTPGDLCHVVRKAIGQGAAQAEQGNVQIVPELPAAAPTLLDLDPLQEVVAALLDNASRFSPAGGRVVVEVRRESEDLCLTVTDQGEGIAPDFLPHVFEAFTDPDVAHHTEGQGLSLAIAQHIVQAHNGTIEVESTQGAGTTFTVRLPVAAPAELDRGETGPSATIRMIGMNEPCLERGTVPA